MFFAGNNIKIIYGIWKIIHMLIIFYCRKFCLERKLEQEVRTCNGSEYCWQQFVQFSFVLAQVSYRNRGGQQSRKTGCG